MSYLKVKRGTVKVWWAQCDPKCPGWVHMDDSMGRGPGLERCDECNRFVSDDSAARSHAKECGCGLKPALPPGPECPSCGSTFTRPCSVTKSCIHCEDCDAAFLDPGAL